MINNIFELQNHLKKLIAEKIKIKLKKIINKNTNKTVFKIKQLLNIIRINLNIFVLYIRV